MNRSIFILGAGGHSKVLLAALRASKNCKVAALVTLETIRLENEVCGVPIISESHFFSKRAYRDVLLVNGVGSVDIPDARRSLFEKFKKMDYKFASVFHPTAWLAEGVELGEGCQVMAGCIIQPACKIGDNVILNTSVSVDHDCFVGSHSHIAPGATLSGGVSLGESCHIGTGAVIIQGIKIGSRSMIAAGAVVTRDFPAGSRVFGIPAK